MQHWCGLDWTVKNLFGSTLPGCCCDMSDDDMLQGQQVWVYLDCCGPVFGYEYVHAHLAGMCLNDDHDLVSMELWGTQQAQADDEVMMGF